MKRCDKLVEVGRRQFLRGGHRCRRGTSVVGLASREARQPAMGTRDYPTAKLANVNDLKPNEPLDVTYPDADAPGVLLKLGKAVEGGAGPDGDIVGFSPSARTRAFRSSYNAGAGR